MYGQEIGHVCHTSSWNLEKKRHNGNVKRFPTPLNVDKGVVKESCSNFGLFLRINTWGTSTSASRNYVDSRHLTSSTSVRRDQQHGGTILLRPGRLTWNLYGRRNHVVVEENHFDSSGRSAIKKTHENAIDQNRRT